MEIAAELQTFKRLPVLILRILGQRASPVWFCAPASSSGKSCSGHQVQIARWDR